MPEGTLPAVNRPVRFNGWFHRGRRTWPGRRWRTRHPVVEPEAGVQAIADSQGVIECESNQRRGDVARDIGENDSDLLRHVVDVVSWAKRIDGIVGQRMRCHDNIFHMAGLDRSCPQRAAQRRKFPEARVSGRQQAFGRPRAGYRAGVCGFTPGWQPRAASDRGCGRGRCIRARTHGCATRRSRWCSPCA